MATSSNSSLRSSVRALPPAELDRLDAVLAAQQADHARLAQQEADQVTRAEYARRLPGGQGHASSVGPSPRRYPVAVISAAIRMLSQGSMPAPNTARSATICGPGWESRRTGTSLPEQESPSC